MNITKFLQDNLLFLDGGMGTLLQQRGLCPGEMPERWNITHSDDVRDIHASYYNAGSNVVNTNTFGANLLKFDQAELDGIICAAVKNARDAAEISTSTGEKFVALDIGPTGKLLKPYGDLDFEDAVAVFAETVRLGVKYGVDLIMIETMNDLYETKAALLAAKENSTLPVFVSNAYSDDGNLMTGASPEAVCALVESMGAAAVGVNCSFGPASLAPVVEKLLACASIPVILKPNAGLPQVCNGKTVYDTTIEDFASEVTRLIEKGVRISGGCCGTTPDYIAALTEKAAKLSPVPTEKKNITWVSSNTHTVKFGKRPILIGERINPTGKKRFKTALIEHDMNYILSEAFAQQERGVHILDVNVGLPEIDEISLLSEAVCEIQAVCDLPLQVDTSDPAAMEAALRRYCGKAMINSVSGNEESMRAVFPLVKKYGGVVVALTLDENGIPESAEERVGIAEKILNTAAEYGIEKHDIIFDTLAMTVSADANAALATLASLDSIRHGLGIHTSLGVSNVSFGLPCRDTVNSTFFAAALERGLSAAIMNPYSEEMMRTYFAHCALHGLDPMCADYINFMAGKASLTSPTQATQGQTPATAGDSRSALSGAIIRGMKERAGNLTKEMLMSGADPLGIVKSEVIPALDEVGRGFEAKTTYLPQLLMSAEAAKSSFEEIRSAVSADGGDKRIKKCSFVLATVKGDIHDIGKNIVKLLLENYGYNVIDLGRDTPPEAVVDAVLKTGAPIVGLSALMTTTVPAMEETISQIRREAPQCRIVVGGAVLTREYARQIGADKYAADAMETVRYAEELNL